MSYIIARKPSGVLHVVTLHDKKEWVLYELASKKLYAIEDDANADCRKMNKERMKMYHEKKRSQMEIPFISLELPKDGEHE